ncbi:sulfotransferase [Nanoarchaeota archaeon]
MELIKPIFIHGCCNSGTTILWEALKEHMELSGPNIDSQEIEELPDSMKHSLGDCTFRLWAHPDFKMCYYRTEEDCNEMDSVVINNVFNKYLTTNRFVAKSPADVYRARLIQGYFPDAYFIAIVRNGYAVSEGIVRKRKFDPDRPQFEGLFTSIDQAAKQWFYSNITVVSHEKFLNKYKIIKYEDLVNDPEKTLHSVLDFCELGKTNFPIPGHFETDHNQMQINRLCDYEIETITRIAQPMLIHFEYPIFGSRLSW